MKEQLVSLADYLESLEQRIAALESANIALQNTINDLQDKLDNLPQASEPEVEVELVVEEEQVPEPELEPEVPEMQETPEPEIQEVQEAPETQESEPAPEPAPEPESAHESAPEPEPMPAPVVEPTLFGPQVDNIRQAISLGDRFLFQRELFHNNGEMMQKTLDEINACSSIEEALQCVAPFGWDQETTTFKLFMNVLKRRFGK